MLDVLIVGAGPAGAVAATVLARAGVTVRLIDRAVFPRDKLCGDTLNPGTLAILRRLRMADTVERCGLRVDGMIVTGEGGVVIEGRYPGDLHGRALTRSELDWALVQEAVDTGAQFESGVSAREALVTTERGRSIVQGIAIRETRQESAVSSSPAGALRARVTIAADGRQSSLAFGLGLARHPPRPRRWAIGAYVEQAHAPSSFGEMHVRHGCYIGVAPVAGGLTNICLVKPSGGGDAALADPAAALRRELGADPLLGDRFRDVRFVRPPVVLGPLAVDAINRPMDGLILAGDASGFVDPMTGDGLRFAIRGGELAALAAMRALEHGWSGVHAELALSRRREFGAKWRFNRILRALVSSPLAVRSAAAGARVAPAAVRAIVARAGDCDLAD